MARKSLNRHHSCKWLLQNHEACKLSELKNLGNHFLNVGLIDTKSNISEFLNAYADILIGNSSVHCFRGYPFYGSILPFESSDSEYIAYLDSDMLI